MTDTLQTLLERLQNAEGPDREIDAMIAVMFDEHAKRPAREYDFKAGIVAIECGDGFWRERPWPLSYTASLDSSIELVEKVLPGKCEWLVSRPVGMPSWHMARIDRFWFPHEVASKGGPAIALITALVQALIAEQE